MSQYSRDGCDLYRLPLPVPKKKKHEISPKCLLARKEEYTQLSFPEHVGYKGPPINKRNPPSRRRPVTKEDIYDRILVLFFIFIIIGALNKDSEIKVSPVVPDKVPSDINKLTDRKKLGQFFQRFDINDDQKLNDKELLRGLLNVYQDTLTKVNASARKFSESELSWMVDFIINSDDKNGNGTISYSVLAPERKKKKSSSTFSYRK